MMNGLNLSSMERSGFDSFAHVMNEQAVQPSPPASPERREFTSEKELIAAALEKARSAELDQIPMEAFVDVYGEEVVERDSQRVAELKAKFDARVKPEEQEKHDLARILEVILIEQVELNNWLGADVNTQQTSLFDDYTNGIDFVAEFNENDAQRYMGFAIDVTTGGESIIDEKLKKIRYNLLDGELGELKYFQSTDQRVQGRMRFVPKVILALDQKTVLELTELWVNKQQHALRDHPLKIDLINEIGLQLRHQLDYVQALHRKNIIGDERSTQLENILQSQLKAMRKIKTSQSHLTTQPSRKVTQMTDIIKHVFSTDRISIHQRHYKKEKENKEERIRKAKTASHIA